MPFERDGHCHQRDMRDILPGNSGFRVTGVWRSHLFLLPLNSIGLI